MNWLKEIRFEKRQTQESVARKASMARTSYTNIETGVRRPSIDAAKKIATVLEFDWTRFYEDTPEKEVAE